MIVLPPDTCRTRAARIIHGSSLHPLDGQQSTNPFIPDEKLRWPDDAPCWSLKHAATIVLVCAKCVQWLLLVVPVKHLSFFSRFCTIFIVGWAKSSCSPIKEIGSIDGWWPTSGSCTCIAIQPWMENRFVLSRPKLERVFPINKKLCCLSVREDTAPMREAEWKYKDYDDNVDHTDEDQC